MAKVTGKGLVTAMVSCITFLLTGCSSNSVPQEVVATISTPTAITSSVTPQSAYTSTQPVEGLVTSVDEIKSTEWSLYSNPEFVFGPKTVAFLEEAPANGLDSDSVAIYGSTSMEPAVVLPPSDPDLDMRGWTVGVQQDPGANSALVMASLERERSSGLQAGATQLVVRVYDDSGSEIHKAQVDNMDSYFLGQASLFGEIAVLAFHEDTSDRDVFLAVNVLNGEVIWRKDCSGRHYLQDSVVSSDGIYVIGCGTTYDNDQRFEGLDVQNGSIQWTIPLGNSILERDPRRLPSTGDIFLNNDDHTVYDSSNGKQLVEGGAYFEDEVFDPVSSLVVTQFNGGFQVTDVSSADTVFELSVEVAEEIGISLLGAFDQRLWFRAKDGLDVIDLRTGAQDSRAPVRDGETAAYSNIPLAAGDTWVLLGYSSVYSTTVTSLYRDPAGNISVDDLPQISGR